MGAGKRALTSRLACVVSCVAAGAASAQPSGTLDSLTRPRAGRTAHYSSFDATEKNDDFRRIEPGQTVTLVDHRGAGTIRRWWITIAPRNNVALHRGLIVRAWWDDEETPSVEVPVSDFFGMGFGEWRDYISLPLNMTSGGYNSYWPMPFKRRARVTVENRSATVVDRFYFNVDIETAPSLPEDTLYFHAQFRRATTQRGKPLTILDARGRGRYAGTVMAMQPRVGRTLWYLEGNERIFIDGETSPSIIGTGTEDYFSSGWYFDTGRYSAPYHGAPIVEPETGRISAYRWHIEDPIAFEKSIRFTIEHGGTNETENVDYTSVAYWYQTHPHAIFPPLPGDLAPVPLWQPKKIAGAIEAESLIGSAKATAGEVQVQDMSPFESAMSTWSEGKQLWWILAKPGAKLTFDLPLPEAGTYELSARFTRASNYGNVRVSVNGRGVSPVVTGYSAIVEPTERISFGRLALRRANKIEVEIVGKDERSSGWSDGFLVGIDAFFIEK